MPIWRGVGAPPPAARRPPALTRIATGALPPSPLPSLSPPADRRPPPAEISPRGVADLAYHPRVALIKTVTNGDKTAVFKAVSLGHVVSIVFGLASIIGAQQTWLWAEAHERTLIVDSIRIQITTDITTRATIEDRRFEQLERKVESLDHDLDALAKQVNVNTGKLGQLPR